jgi:hypothetical protein
MWPVRARLAWCLTLLLFAPNARAQEGQGAEELKKPGTVLTFYGIRKLEEDPKVSDEDKVREWEGFIIRAGEQVDYARRAIERWKVAARVRMLERARIADQDAATAPAAKLERWRELQRLYPKGPEAKEAKARITFWEKDETRRLVDAAEQVEAGKKPKTERIRAWMDVLSWVDRGPEAKRAERRIVELQGQLYAEAESVDGIARVDAATKLDAWRDVLAGRPTDAQRDKAKARVAALEAEQGGGAKAGGGAPPGAAGAAAGPKAETPPRR